MDDLPVEHTDPYKVIRISDQLYNVWKDITLANVRYHSREKAQAEMLSQLRGFILRNHPTCKLCAFDELSESDGQAAGVPSGFYIKIREMTSEERELSARCKQGNLPMHSLSVEDPQWTLEFSGQREMKYRYWSINGMLNGGQAV